MMSRFVNVGLTVFGLLFITLFLTLGVMMWWSRSTPRHPSNIPAHAIWIPAPLVAFDTSRRGDWLGCSTEASGNWCVVAQANGTIEYGGFFLPWRGLGPVSEEHLKFSAQSSADLWVWLKQEDKGVPIVRLQDGMVLLPVNGYEELKAWLDKSAPPSL